MHKLRHFLDLASKSLVFIPLLWILLGLAIKVLFYTSTGRWPESVNYFNPIEFPEFLRPAFTLLILMAIYSFLYLPAILLLLIFNCLVVRKESRKFFTIWLPFFGGTALAAFFLLRFFGKSFEYFM